MSRFVRLVPGPDREHPVDGGSIRVVGVEVYDDRLRVRAHHRLDSGEYTTGGGLLLRSTVADDLGTTYERCGGGGGGNELGFHAHQDFEPPPPQGARTLTIGYQQGAEVVVPLANP